MALRKRKQFILLPLLFLALLGAVAPLQTVHGAVTWSSPTLIDHASGIDMLTTALQAKNGTIWIAWQSDRYAQTTGRFDIILKTLTNGIWSTDYTLTSSNQNTAPTLVQLSNGTIAVFWAAKPANSYEIFYSRYITSGWSTAAQITTTTLNDTSPAATVGRDGTVWLTWTRVNSTNHSIPAIKQIYYKTLKNNVWSPDIQLTTDTNQNYGSTVMVSKDGLVRVTWSKGAAGNNYQLYTKSYNTTWTADTQIVSSASTDEHPSMIQDRNGTLWLFWGRLIVVSLTVQYYALYGKYSYDLGRAWSSEIALTNTANTVDSFMPSAIQSTTGVKPVWIFYTSNLNEPDYDIFSITSNGIANVHDLTVSNISASSNLGTTWQYPGGLRSVGQTAIMTVTVTITNIGDFVENAGITLTATNITTAYTGTTSGLVGAGNTMSFYFYWNTTTTNPARYGLAVSIATLPGETLGNLGDNKYSVTNMIHIIPLADVDQDGSVTITDFSVFAYGFGFSVGSPRYNPYADIRGIGIIDIVDVSVAQHNFDIFT